MRLPKWDKVLHYATLVVGITAFMPYESCFNYLIYGGHAIVRANL